MTAFAPWKTIRQWVDRESLQPDIARAVRATVAFMVPMLLTASGHLPFEVTFVALAAQNIAIVDVRGSYTLRFGLLLAMTAILSGATALGAFAAPSRVRVSAACS